MHDAKASCVRASGYVGLAGSSRGGPVPRDDQGMIRDATVKDFDTDKEIPAAEVETVETVEDARERLSRGGVDVLVFNSRSQISAARELKRAFPNVPIIVMTGLIPKEEVIIVCKSWLTNQGARHIILDLSY